MVDIMPQRFDATKMKDWEIAEAAEETMKSVVQISKELELEDKELLPYGHHVGKLDYQAILKRLKNKPDGKYIDVTAVTPTPLGEGKSTTSMGLVQGMGKLGKSVIGAIRQPSSGPTFNLKGSAAGGGLAQCIPLTDLSLGLTGDFDAIGNAHNLCMAALMSRIDKEFKYPDAFLIKNKMKRLNIDPRNVEMKWVIDFAAQSLRNINVGLGGDMDGFMMQSGFTILVASELMAILAVASDLKDLRERISRIVVAYDKTKSQNPITTADLEVDGAMTAIMARTLNPNLMQTIEGQPVLVHAGPFANIAIGQSSIIADRVGLKLADYHITESGFGADIGFEKFWNLKCRFSGLKPHCSVIVATVRALKMHGGGPEVIPGRPLHSAYTKSHPDLVERGCENLIAHIETVKKSGITPVVCINHFYTDSDDEVNVIRNAAKAAGTRVATSKHWEKGGEGALELAEAVIEACEEKSNFKFLYEDELPLKSKIHKIATEIYGADGVSYSAEAESKIARIDQDKRLKNFSCCMVKTHLSLSHDKTVKGRPTGWTLPIRDVLTYGGAGFVVPVAGDISLMPGMVTDAAYRRIDIDVETGKVRGLF